MEKECHYTEEDDPHTLLKYLPWLVANSVENGGLLYLDRLARIDGLVRYEMQFLDKLRPSPHKMILNGCQIELITDKNIPHSGKNRPLLAFIPRDKELTKLHGILDIPKMLVIPWVMKEIKDWISYSNAVKFGEKVAVRKINLSKVVMTALDYMTTSINIANSMIHPRNKEVTIDTFLKLKERAGEVFDPVEVRRWIISQAHWNPEDAQAVYDIASGIKSGKKYRTTNWSNFWGNDIVEQWRKDSEIKD